MGMSYYTNVCYGFIIYNAEDYKDPIFKQDMDTWDFIENLYDSIPGVEIVYFGWEPTIYAIAISETVESHEYEPFVIECKEPDNEAWEARLKLFCKKNNLQYKEPNWIAGIQIS